MRFVWTGDDEIHPVWHILFGHMEFMVWVWMRVWFLWFVCDAHTINMDMNGEKGCLYKGDRPNKWNVYSANTLNDSMAE